MNGRLYLVPAPLDFGCDPPLPPVTDVLPLATLQHMARLQYWVCENARTLRALLKRVDEVQPLAQPLQRLDIREIPRAWHKKGDHVGEPDMVLARELLAPTLQGQDMAIASEAGMPAVADPGASLVRAAHALGITVVPLVGPSSILLAVAASGLNGQSFAFHGYLPIDAVARTNKIKQIEQRIYSEHETQLFIETPYRNNKLAEELVRTCRPSTKLCIASNITCEDEYIKTKPVKEWAGKIPDLSKKPTIFLIYK